MPQLGLTGVPLAKVPDRFPPAMQAEVRQAVEELLSRFADYRKIAGKTRTLLEQNLHEVDSIIVQLGGPPAAGPGGPGYGRETEGSAPPPSMKTDFRA